MKKWFYAVVSLHITLAGYVIYFFGTFPDRVEQRVVVQQEFKPPRIPVEFKYCTVRVRIASNNGTGSGVALSPKVFLTNKHVVASLGEADTVWVSWSDESGDYSEVATVLAMDDARDLAILSLNKESATFGHYARISKKTDLAWGDPVVIVGGPLGSPLVPEPGAFVSPNDGAGMYLIKGNVFPGSSGGPVFNAVTGDVCGVVARMYGITRMNGIPMILNYVVRVVPADWINSFLREHGMETY